MSPVRQILKMILVLFTGCTAGQDPIIPVLFGGAEGIATMSTPDKVEAWRTTSRAKLMEEEPEGKKVTQTKGKLADYLIVEGPVEVDAKSSAELATLLQSNIYIHYEEDLDCLPKPGFAVRFNKGTNSVLVFFCFECGIMESYINNEERSRMGYFSGGTLLPLLKRVSP